MKFQNKVIGVAALAGSYLGLMFLAKMEFVPLALRYGICAYLNVFLVALIALLAVYLAYNVIKERRLDSIIALLFVLATGYFIGPVWMAMSYNFACKTMTLIKTEPMQTIELNVPAAQSSGEKHALVEISNKAEYEAKVLKSAKPVVLKCSAVWCPPCQTMKPIFEKVAQELGDQIVFAEVDIDLFTDRDILNVQSIPTFICYKNGAEAFRFSGTKNRNELKAEIEKLLK